MVLIFVDEITERLIFTFDFVFLERQIEYEFTNDPLYFERIQENKFNYSNRYFENIKGLIPATILFDEAIFPYSIEKSSFENEECLTFDGISDPLAAIFYVLSRMEEYSNPKRDIHDRFPAKESILYKYGWLRKVVCDRWAEAFIRSMEKELNISLNLQKSSVKIIPTFDIDNTFAFQWKHGLRRVLATVRDFIKGDRVRMERRKAVLLGNSKDPYDTFDYILEISNRGFDVHLFWLLGDYAKFDKNISSMDQRHRSLIRRMSEQVKVGLHPSYRSNSGTYYLENEKERIDSILEGNINFSRQHFLKLSFPETYRNLIKAGFKHDYTMGYADEPGFRAGTARPFRFFDLGSNSLTDYIIHPFSYMDGTIHEYKALSMDESKVLILNLYREIEQFGGDFIFIWHNETIGDFAKWKGWKQVLEFTLSLKNGN